MLTNANKKVICVKNIPSNLIEEAFFILKADRENLKNPKKEEMKNRIIMQEAKEFLNTYSLELEKEKQKQEELLKQIRKIRYAFGITIFCIVCTLVLVMFYF